MSASCKAEERVLVIDFGSQYTRLICRRLRELSVYSEIRKYDVSLEEVERFCPLAVVLSGGPSSVYAENAPRLGRDVWQWLLASKTPLLGVCYGQQLLVQELGGKVSPGDKREYGSALVKMTAAGASLLNCESMKVWMSHGDKVVVLPDEMEILGFSDNCEFSIIGDKTRRIYGVQFHPEVSHCEGGTDFLKFFLQTSDCHFLWNMQSFVQHELAQLCSTVNAHSDAMVIGGVSGGVDSTVAAALTHRALGKDRFMAVLVDSGLLRHNEAQEVKHRLETSIGNGFVLHVVDAKSVFFAALAGVTDPEEKRKIIGRVFIQVFAAFVHDQVRAGVMSATCKKFLLQGTLYPDVIESESGLKSHHNVGGLPADLQMELLEPFRFLFKDEVRKLGRTLGCLSEADLMRHPFPGPGLALRIIGAVDERRVALVRAADAIFMDELHKTGEYYRVSQAFAILLPDVQTVGIMGDQRSYECLCALRAVTSEDFMTADFHQFEWPVLGHVGRRIVNEVRGINRIVYDITSKPPGTIEWL